MRLGEVWLDLEGLGIMDNPFMNLALPGESSSKVGMRSVLVGTFFHTISP